MIDIVDQVTRSRMMSGIRGRDTRPELVVRRYLHAAGLRFRLAPKNLPGKPDIVLPKYGTIVFVHGCFWHRHDGCKYATTPSTRAEFWAKKFESNVLRDQRTERRLREEGWHVIVMWECALNTRNLASLKKRIISRHPKA